MIKKYSDENALQAVRKTKLESIIKSDYENIETIEDYKLYLDYLKLSLKTAKTKEDKNVINTKIASIVKIIDEMRMKQKQQEENPLNLQLYINRFIYDIINKIDELDDGNRKNIARELKQILIDFKQIVDDYNQKKNAGLYLGNPMLPMGILDRIVDIEFKLKSLQKSKGISNYSNDELRDIEEELNSVIYKKVERNSNIWIKKYKFY